MIAAVAAAVSPPAAAAGSNAGKAPQIEIVHFGDRRLPPVRIVRGRGRAPVPSASAAPPVAVMHGSGETLVAFTDPHEPPVTVLRGIVLESSGIDLFRPVFEPDLDRVAFAVDGAESSHGLDPRMWRAELDGPQGPMQVSAAAALDSGGGDRFDLGENRVLGRAYLAKLYRRYGNWADAIAAYNWGPGNLDAWIGAGRPAAALPLGVEAYRDRVLHDSTALPGRR